MDGKCKPVDLSHNAFHPYPATRTVRRVTEASRTALNASSTVPVPPRAVRACNLSHNVFAEFFDARPCLAAGWQTSPSSLGLSVPLCESMVDWMFSVVLSSPNSLWSPTARRGEGEEKEANTVIFLCHKHICPGRCGQTE